jgi:hypothetical protein
VRLARVLDVCCATIDNQPGSCELNRVSPFSRDPSYDPAPRLVRINAPYQVTEASRQAVKKKHRIASRE